MRPNPWRALARAIAARPLAVAGLGVLVCALAGAFASQNLGFKTSRIELTGAEIGFAKRHLALEAEFGDLNRMVVAVQGEPAACRAYADELVERVRADEEHFRGVFARVSPADLGPQALVFLPPERLAEAAGTLARLGPELRAGPLAGSLAALARELRWRLEDPEAEQASAAGFLGELAPRLLQDTLALLRGQPVAATPLDRIPALDEEGYTWGADGRTLLVLVAFREEGSALDPRTAAVTALRALVAEMRAAHPEVEVGLTGKPVLEVDEMKTYEADSLRASLAALFGVTLLLVFALRRLSAPLLVGFSLALSVALTLGLAAIWPGHLNLMAVVFVIVVIGLGVDFGIHLIGRYDEARRAGSPPAEAISTALGKTGPAVAAGAATTAGAFFGAITTDFKGLREFGAVAGLGVLASVAVMLTVLPALVLRLDRRDPRPARPSPFGALDRLTQRRPRALLGVIALLSLGAACALPSLRYDANLLEMQDPSLDSVQLELALLRDQRLTSWFLAYATKDLDELAEVSSRVAALPGVRKVESALTLYPADLEARLPGAQRVQRLLRAALGEPLPASDAAGLERALAALDEALAEGLELAVANGLSEAIPRLEELSDLCLAAQEALAPGEQPSAALADYDRRLGEAMRRRAAPLLAEPLALVGPAHLPPALAERFVGPQGSYLLRIYPHGNLWDPAELASFLAEVRRELPTVSGVPVLLHDSSELMLRSYQQAGYVALAVVLACLLLLFRALRPTLLALSALLVGALWTAGLLSLCGIEFNPANLVALPLLLGIGIDTAVHVVHRASEAGPRAPLAGTSLGRALVYSGLTSVASFGSLLLADHPGTASIGATISLGILCCVTAGLTVPGALLNAWAPREPGGAP